MKTIITEEILVKCLKCNIQSEFSIPFVSDKFHASYYFLSPTLIQHIKDEENPEIDPFLGAIIRIRCLHCFSITTFAGTELPILDGRIHIHKTFTFRKIPAIFFLNFKAFIVHDFKYKESFVRPRKIIEYDFKNSMKMDEGFHLSERILPYIYFSRITLYLIDQQPEDITFFNSLIKMKIVGHENFSVSKHFSDIFEDEKNVSFSFTHTAKNMTIIAYFSTDSTYMEFTLPYRNKGKIIHTNCFERGFHTMKLDALDYKRECLECKVQFFQNHFAQKLKIKHWANMIFFVPKE